jgi:ribonuclease R
MRLAREGYGFVVPSEAGAARLARTASQGEVGGDIFVPARFVGGALHTDIVEVRLVPGRGMKMEGRIVRVVERRVKSLVGRLESRDHVFTVIADDRRVKHRIIIPPDCLGGAHPGDTVVAGITAYSEADSPMRGEVTAVLGERGEEATEREAVIVRHQLRRDFTNAVIEEAGRARACMDGDDGAERKDLRDLGFVTIDGESAEDFDDAVAVKPLDDGSIRLWVSIADVSFFVQPNTALDREAFERGTSVYFPGFCLPMLPETISNDLCSLRPLEDRFCLSAEMDIDPEGRTVRSRFYRSVIRSTARLTYTDVKSVLVDQNADARKRLADQISDLEIMQDCFRRMRKRRLDRGSIDFDLPEPQIQIDMQGAIEDIVRAERHVGHMMIEEFMIAANEAVAEFLTKRHLGCIYRVHQPPPDEKLAEFAVFVHNLGYGGRISPQALPGTLAAVVRWAHGKPWERLVNHSLLRSMSQAVYSTANRGHYGLASKCYCHFTSPIRRYPDLMVHRLLSLALSGQHDAGNKGQKANKGLDDIAEQSSRCERKAMDAEREMAKLYAAIFMQGRVGEEFDGVISHVAKFGAFVELDEFFVEGLLHVNALDDDHYIYDEGGMCLMGKRSKRSYRVGDRVRIEVSDVNIADREILFELV